MQRILKVMGVLPDFNSFKISVSSIMGVVDGSTLYVATGDDKNISAYATVFNDQVTIIDTTTASALVSAVPNPAVVCYVCGNTYTPKKPVMPNISMA